MALQIRSPAAQIKSYGHAHTSATSAKVPAVIGGVAVIPLNSADANVRNAYVYEAEVSGMPKAAGAITIHQPLYWNGTAVTTADGGGSNQPIGYALEASASGDTETGLVAFNSFA